MDLNKLQPAKKSLEVVKLRAQRRATKSVCSARLPVARIIKVMFPWMAPDMTSVQRCPQSISKHHVWLVFLGMSQPQTRTMILEEFD